MKNKFLANKRELRDYIIWGAISAVVNIGAFQLLMILGIDYKISNIVALVFNRFFCYFTNKIIVFRKKSENALAMIKEIISFFLARMISFFIDYFGVMLLIELLSFNKLMSKILIAFIVIIVNYIFSKYFVFNTRNRTRDKDEIDNSNSML